VSTGPGPGAGRSLAERQAELVRALVGGGPPAAGFDAERLAATSLALRRKRAGVVAHVWPTLRALPDFESRYAAWAEARSPGSAVEDGVAFALSLGTDLPGPVAVELVAARRRRCLRSRAGLVVRFFGVRQLPVLRTAPADTV
jgi:hypothetical protein